jgi:hypothetical protein
MRVSTLSGVVIWGGMSAARAGVNARALTSVVASRILVLIVVFLSFVSLLWIS